MYSNAGNSINPSRQITVTPSFRYQSEKFPEFLNFIFNLLDLKYDYIITF